MSTATTSKPKTVPAKTSPLAATLTLVVLTVIAFALLIGFRVFGVVSGEEFSPAKLEQRYFSYYQIPIIRKQISAVGYKPRPIPTLEALLSEPYFPKPLPGEGRWDLVYGKRSWGRVEGDANILLDYLRARNDRGESIWEVWSMDNPPLAAVFWPEVVNTIRKEEYVKLPDLFEKAREATTPEELAAKLGVPLPPNLPPPKTPAPATGTTPAVNAPAATPAVDGIEKAPESQSGDQEKSAAQEPIVPATY